MAEGPVSGFGIYFALGGQPVFHRVSVLTAAAFVDGVRALGDAFET